MKKQFIAAVVVAACMFAGTGSAFAGEVNGKGDPLPSKDKARSDCVFSGLQDDPFAPGATQTWGQIVKNAPPGAIRAGADGPHHAPDGSIVGCNASLYPINLPEE